MGLVSPRGILDPLTLLLRRLLYDFVGPPTAAR